MPIDRATRFNVLTEAGFRCHYCGRGSREVVLEVDHVKPRSDGGTDHRSNLVAACFDCNRGKHATLVPPIVAFTKDYSSGGNGEFTIHSTATTPDEFLEACADELCTALEDHWGDWNFTLSALLPLICERWLQLRFDNPEDQ